MSLNIKNEETHRLAKELADLTGETLAVAVTLSVRERLDRLRHKDSSGLADRLLAIGRDCAIRLPDADRTANHGEMLYAEDGSPRLPGPM